MVVAAVEKFRIAAVRQFLERVHIESGIDDSVFQALVALVNVIDRAKKKITDFFPRQIKSI